MEWVSQMSGMTVLFAMGASAVCGPIPGGKAAGQVDTWRAKWEQNIVAESKDRYCDREMGEELGWLVSPFVSGYYYGYLATHDTAWIDRLIDWTDAWSSRGIKEPDGFIGWPKSGSGGSFEDQLDSDSLLGEAMALRPAVLMAAEIKSDPSLKKRYGDKANGFIRLAERTFQKWDRRGCWREVGSGGLWVVPTFGIDVKTGKWTDGYAKRLTDGFSNPDNKENLIAEWMTALYDATGKPVYKDRAEKWWRIMKARMKPQDGGKHVVWNYWEPAGPWDYKPDGSTKHWVGVHPNGGYYGVDVEAIANAFQHGLVFTKADIDKLVATNRDFMWNHQFATAQFRRLDGGEPDPRWKTSPGVLWTGLLPYDPTLKRIFEATHNPTSWGGLSATPWYLSTFAQKTR